MHTFKELAYAKINLFLDVLSLREDGFHDIRSVMHTVSLCDEVTLTLTPAKGASVSITVEDAPYVPADGRNLAYQAAETFLRRGHFHDRVDIHLVKRIPTAAGMAGGSSDAAAVLRGLNKLYRKPFSSRALLSMAVELGSDVPFCLLGHTALCEGRGERMTPLNAPKGVSFVVACADERISAKAAYAVLDERYASFDGSVATGGDGAFDALCAWLHGNGPMPQRLFNIFEDAVMSLCEGAAAIRRTLMREGASLALLSGSGPSVFGVFTDRSLAEAAAACLRAEGVRAFAVSSV
ncbi:MAG: 4-(cytidine 5'-diphospho)-2-C-methyl-D-erythritol kinase [Clostridia bacterium]|nr:4-(cytidine 5'-diphospho)-2-C-methyl-D-erythritol kinase [Clostridia bacterium]